MGTGLDRLNGLSSALRGGIATSILAWSAVQVLPVVRDVRDQSLW